MKAHHENNPSVMTQRFEKMASHNAGLFTIRRLNITESKGGHPSTPVRATIHSFVYITEGETLIFIGDQSYLFKANECAIIAAEQTFSIQYYNNCKGYMGGFHNDFLHTWNTGVNPPAAFSFLRRWGDHKILLDSGRRDNITALFERLCVENEKDTKNNNILKAYLTALLVELDEAYKQNDTSRLSTDNKLCNDFIEYVFLNPAERLPISEYAERLNVTQAHLHKTVKRFTQKTPLAWLNEASILEAKTLLMHSDMPINEIALKVGLLDPAYFSRLFKKQVGITPNEFRSKIKNPQKG